MLRAVDYASYLRLFVETVRPEILSYDYYPFLGRDRSLSADKLFLVETERERGIRQAAARMEDRTEFFRNLGAIREAGLEAGIPTMLILQLTEHGYYRNPTKEELLWQVTHALAYGVSRISYFTYWLPDSDDGFWLWDNAMVERDGSPIPTIIRCGRSTAGCEAWERRWRAGPVRRFSTPIRRSPTGSPASPRRPAFSQRRRRGSGLLRRRLLSGHQQGFSRPRRPGAGDYGRTSVLG